MFLEVFIRDFTDRFCRAVSLIFVTVIFSVAARRDELFVSTGSGLLQRVTWDGFLEGGLTLSIHSLPFTNDLENARGKFTLFT